MCVHVRKLPINMMGTRKLSARAGALRVCAELGSLRVCVSSLPLFRAHAHPLPTHHTHTHTINTHTHSPHSFMSEGIY